MDTSPFITPLAASVLRELAAAPAEAGMSLPRLGKRLGQGVSVLMRTLALMGNASIGGVQGPGWVQVVQLDDRWVAHITPAGYAVVANLLQPTSGNSPSSITAPCSNRSLKPANGGEVRQGRTA